MWSRSEKTDRATQSLASNADEPALLFLVGLGGLREECAGQIVPFSHLCDDAGSRQG